MGNTPKTSEEFIRDLRPQDVDAMIAGDLHSMSLQEREHCYHDIHGVSDAIDETPEFVQEKLKELDDELGRAPSWNNKAAYLQAEADDPEFVRCTKLRLKFLRTYAFDVKKAASHLLRFFEQKLLTFGRELLTKDIKLSDMDANDIRCLESGKYQLVPQRDRAGRKLFACIMAKESNEGSVEQQLAKSRCRVLYYMMMALAEDEMTQKLGMIVTMVTTGNKEPLNFEIMKKMTLLLRALPVRFAAVHILSESMAKAKSLNIVMAFLRNRDRARFRSHAGSFQELRYVMMSFGIVMMDMLPTTEDGEFPLENHWKWIAQRWQLESMEHQERPILPRPTDVIMGRDWDAQIHPGTIRLREIIAMHRDAYDNAKKLEKTMITREIVQEVKAGGNRFLKSDGAGGYVVVDDSVAREKVSSSFRDRRKKAANTEGTIRKRQQVSFLSPFGPLDRGCYEFAESKRAKCSFRI